MDQIKSLILGKPPAADVIQEIIGNFGKFHYFLCFMLFLSKFFVAFHQMAIIFLAPKIVYQCSEEDDTTMACPCPNPIYDKSIFSRSMVMEWDLICGRKWLISFSQTLFQLGTLIGSICYGMAADRFGRRLPLLAAMTVQFVAGVAAAYMPDYWSFTIVRFILGTSVGGSMVTSFVILMEFVGHKYRDTISALYQVPFNMGHMLLAPISYYLRDYSHFQLAIAAPGVILLSYFVLIPETPRWLIAVHRTEDAIKIVTKVAKINNRPTANIRTEMIAYEATLKQKILKKGTIVDLFRTPNIRKNIICMSLNWLACSYCFYGVSQYIGQLGGDAFVNVAISATVTLLGTLSSIPLMKLMGRRTILIIFNFVCATCLIVLALIPEGGGSVAMASIGVVSSFIVFVLVYLYCGELFPTVVRNAALGFSSMIARVGSMIAPFVVDLRAIGKWLPPLVFAIIPLIAGFATFLLPETKGTKLMTTIEEGEAFGKKVKKTPE